jgi:phosphatidylinositol alpha-1,6-mannosyltransferase
LEAQSSGKPIVAFNTSGVSEAVLGGETGLLVEPGGNGFASEILRLLADESLRNRLGSRGRERAVKEFTWDVCAKKMLDIYLEVKG